MPPALISMMVWAARHDEATEAPASFAASFEKDPEGTIAWYEAEIDRVDRALRSG